MSQKKSSNRSKKFPPPPLHLPIPNHTTVEDKSSNEEQKSSTNCSSSSQQCSHEQTSYILPVNQRPQIIQTLIDTSSNLLFQPICEPKNKRSHISLNTTQINYLKRQHASRQTPVNENEWMDLMRFVISKPFEDDLIMLLDKYKTTYFDRVNSPNTSDATIRTNLCDMASQILLTYASNSPTNSSKRKRPDEIIHPDKSPKIEINSQTKFVIVFNQSPQQSNSLNHLFKYIPDENDEEYLRNEGYLKSDHQIQQICLMFYDEIHHLNELIISDPFSLPVSILTRIQSILNENFEK